MGMLINGQWSTKWYEPDAKGHFVRSVTQFRDWITADGSSGFAAEPDRYHLYVSYACPWAHRTLIVRKLRGLESVIPISVVDPLMFDEGWAFSDNPGCVPDPISAAPFLRDVYTRAVADFTGRVTVPVLWDKRRGTIVNNESLEIVRMFDTAFLEAGLGDPGVCFYPEALRAQIDQTVEAIYQPINNGVYRAGFATTQSAYDEAVHALFDALERWDAVLAVQPFLCGDVVTEADWCLFTTLVRFDLVYHLHFKCNIKRIADFPSLSRYLRDLYQIPGVAGTCNFDHIKEHYFRSHPSINPHRVVPAGPASFL